MPTIHLRRSIVAVTTAIACLVALANPAAAVPVTYRAEITAGQVTVTKTGITPTVFDLSPASLCAPGATADLDLSSDTTSSSVSITAFDAALVTDFGLGGTPYLVVLTRSPFSNIPGHLDSDSTPHTITGSRHGLVIRIYLTTGCTPTGNPVCTLGVALGLSNVTTTSVSPSTTFSYDGSSVGTIAGFPTCATGPSQILGATVTVTSPVTGHLTEAG